MVPTNHFQGPYCGAARRLSAESEDLRWLRLCTTEKLSLDALIWKYKEAQFWGTLQVHSPQVKRDVDKWCCRPHSGQKGATTRSTGPPLRQPSLRCGRRCTPHRRCSSSMPLRCSRQWRRLSSKRSCPGAWRASSPCFMLRSWRVSTRARSKLVGSALGRDGTPTKPSRPLKPPSLLDLRYRLTGGDFKKGLLRWGGVWLGFPGKWGGCACFHP